MLQPSKVVGKQNQFFCHVKDHPW